MILCMMIEILDIGKIYMQLFFIFKQIIDIYLNK